MEIRFSREIFERTLSNEESASTDRTMMGPFRLSASFEMEDLQSGLINVEKKEKEYVSYFPKLNITSQGKSFQETLFKLGEQVEGMLNFALKHGKLLECLKKIGFDIPQSKMRD